MKIEDGPTTAEDVALISEAWRIQRRERLVADLKRASWWGLATAVAAGALTLLVGG